MIFKHQSVQNREKLYSCSPRNCLIVLLLTILLRLLFELLKSAHNTFNITAYRSEHHQNEERKYCRNRNCSIIGSRRRNGCRLVIDFEMAASKSFSSSTMARFRRSGFGPSGSEITRLIAVPFPADIVEDFCFYFFKFSL